MAGPYAFLHRRTVAQPKPFRPQNEGSASFLHELFRQERAGEPAPGERLVSGQSVEAPGEERETVDEASHGGDSFRERRSAVRVVEIVRESRHRPTLGIELTSRVAAHGEDLDRAPRRP